MTDLQIEELENYFKPIYYVEYEIIERHKEQRK